MDSKELLGLEYLFRQSSGEAFSLGGIDNDGHTEEEEVIRPDQADPVEAYVSNAEASEDTSLDMAPTQFAVTSHDTSTSGPGLLHLRMYAVRNHSWTLRSWSDSALH